MWKEFGRKNKKLTKFIKNIYYVCIQDQNTTPKSQKNNHMSIN